jgi:putative sterol carrier protein
MADEEVDPAQVAEAVKGLSDEELTKQIQERGVDNTLKQIFDGMQDAFMPDKAAGVNAVIQYDVAVNGDTKSWSVNIADGKCKTSEGASENPRLTLQTNLPDFMRLIFNQADGTQLFMSGKLKLKGDMMFAMQMQNFFERRF